MNINIIKSFEIKKGRVNDGKNRESQRKKEREIDIEKDKEIKRET